jgi:hypothetical protein
MMRRPISKQWVLACGLVLACATSQAAVYKCQGADGKPVYRDTACSTEQSGGAVPGISNSPTTRAPTPSAKVEEGKGLVQRAQRAQGQAGLTPECQALGDKASEALRQDSASLDDVKRAVGEFERRCGDQVEKAMRAGGVGSPKQPLKIDDANCRKLRDLLEETRAQLARMTDKEKMAYAQLQNEVSVACK